MRKAHKSTHESMKILAEYQSLLILQRVLESFAINYMLRLQNKKKKVTVYYGFKTIDA